jgi:aryl-alcohol dehydrogenase-like predicted oxidoreductase
MTFGGQTDRAAAARMLDIAFDRGVNFVDTANVYTAGESERILGDLLGARRAQVILASKVGMKACDEEPGLSLGAILAAVENGLRRLATDDLDLCYLHLPDGSAPLEESLAARIRWCVRARFVTSQLELCKLAGLQDAMDRGAARLSSGASGSAHAQPAGAPDRR